MSLPASSRTPLSKDLDLVERYTDQPSGLPTSVRERVAREWGGEAIELYALADLDADLRLAHTWVVLGATRIAFARPDRDEFRSLARSQVRALRDSQGLSCNTLLILGAKGEPEIARLHFTHRQRRAMENVSFALERGIDGLSVPSADPDREYIEGLVRPIRDAQALVARRRSGVLLRLLGYLRPYLNRVVPGMAAATVLTGLMLVPPLITGYLIDSIVEPVQSGVLSLQAAMTAAWLAVAGLAAVYALRTACNWLRLRMMAFLGELVARDLRTDLYGHMQKLDMGFFQRKKTGSLITRVTSDTDRLWEFLAFGVVDVSLSAVLLVGLAVVLISLDLKLGLIMTLPVPLLCFAIWRHGEQMKDIFLRAWRKWSHVTDVVSDTIPGVRVVKAFHQQDRERARFGARNHSAAEEFNQVHAVWTTFWPLLMMSVHAVTIAVWVFALPRLLDASAPEPLSAGTFVSFLLYTTMFVQPIEIIGQMARIMNRATTSAHRVFEILDTQPEVREPEDGVVLEPVRGRIEFDRVGFAYDGLRQVLRDVSFEVAPGEMIGLVGPSGGGKSTIISLIARFWDASAGEIRIDGVPISELDSGTFRRQLGMVLQDPYLFHGTVTENIRYGRPDASLEEVVAAARAANAHDFICRMPHAYDEIVGERGQTLSGGERQRVSIARAILCDPRILILDEATSAVDTETEFYIHEALERLIEGRTVIAIAHRLSTLKRADRLFVVEDGRMTETGTHAELLARPAGTYRRLHDMQIQLHEGEARA